MDSPSTKNSTGLIKGMEKEGYNSWVFRRAVCLVEEFKMLEASMSAIVSVSG